MRATLIEFEWNSGLYSCLPELILYRSYFQCIDRYGRISLHLLAFLSFHSFQRVVSFDIKLTRDALFNVTRQNSAAFTLRCKRADC